MDRPLVGIVMGSNSDLDKLRGAFDILNELDVPFEVTVASAHRTPDDAANYAKNARDRGIKVIIAAAGLSAALPGVLAAHTTLPVIGLPLEAGPLKGVDALLSIAQMPPGVPVAAVGIGGAINAALLAIEMLCLYDRSFEDKIREYRDKSSEKVLKARKDLGDLPTAPIEAFS
ncbi:MAG TPA: 5-(carboxyamino)imidazole ribonucleotide mutase [Acetomicrobium flavidum]|uniref:5-(carboxyamino)imidazole ribonucleotide mutase n=1 Tax=Acetomicrobium flavidum TaxID=49896 RepID=UPI002CDD243B|nr:5-(carboxyamino)imidazole ribonucleotide mutase [Acetomicrobium flavidum]HOM31379.1 5-(carboxyamino)imidazole ribonucleotide mutase [Acetomicrobium flavidum]HPP15011.1 5-(carboxyamino)imidazole ribonucleotide mutase [Acetomicrobium flavidum]